MHKSLPGLGKAFIAIRYVREVIQKARAGFEWGIKRCIFGGIMKPAGVGNIPL